MQNLQGCFAGGNEMMKTNSGEPPADAAPLDEVSELRKQVAEANEKNLRLLAELRNTEQRLRREREESLRYAESDFARELLVVLDDLVRTQEAAKSATDAQAVGDGVRIVYEHFLKVLRARGIHPIHAVGHRFDPDQHEALLQQPSDEHPAGQVIGEVAHGYKMHNRVLRPSRVIVSSGPGDGKTTTE